MPIRRITTCTGHRAGIYALAPGDTPGQWISAAGDGWIVAWGPDDLENGRLVASVETQVFALCHLPEQHLLVAGNMNGGIHWIDRNDTTQNRNIQHHRKGTYALLPTPHGLFSAGGDGVLTRWSVPERRSLESLQLSAQALRCLAFAPQTGLLAIGASDHHIYLVQAETMELLRTLTHAHTNSVFSLAFSPDGRYLLSGGRDAMLRVWDSREDWQEISAQPAHLYTVNDIVYSPGGQLFATASRDRTIKIWDAETFQLLKVIDTVRYGGHINSVNRLLWLPEYLVSGSDDRTMMLWEITL